MPCAASIPTSKPGRPRFLRSRRIIPQMEGETEKFNGDASLRRGFSGLDHHQLVLARLVPAAERRGLVVLLRVEAGDALLERRELDDDEAVEFLGAFEGLVAPAAREHLRAVFRQDRGHAVRVFLVFHGIVDLGAGYPIGGHLVSPHESRSMNSRGWAITASASQALGSPPSPW